MDQTNLNKRYGDWALITGASSGIGKEFAFRLAELGMNVFVIARRENNLISICYEINKKGKGSAEYLSIDLFASDAANIIKTATENKEVGLLINNAGISSNGKITNSNREYDVNMVKLHCKMPVELTHIFLDKMTERKKGAIVFVGSVLGAYPTPLASLYSASKSFNIYYALSLAYELKEHNIDVLSLNPGSTATEMRRHNKTSFKFLVRTPEQVFDSFIKNIGKNSLVYDGFANRFMTGVVNLFPMRIKPYLTGRIISKLK